MEKKKYSETSIFKYYRKEVKIMANENKKISKKYVDNNGNGKDISVDITIDLPNKFLNKQVNSVQLTINNPKDKNITHEKISNIIRKHFKTWEFFCMCDEQGSCYHIHVYCYFSSRVRLSMFKKYFPEAHIEICKGTVSDNVNYIKKEGKWKNDKSKQEKVIKGSYEEWGIQPPDSKGSRNDMSILFQMIESGYTNREIIEENQDYIQSYEKLDRIRNDVLTEKYKDVIKDDRKVTYISGKTGLGKTWLVYKRFGFSEVYRVTDYEHPYDGYSFQQILFFDEFRDSRPLSEMLTVLDIYPTQLKARYVNRVASYDEVYIASNWTLEEQYQKEQIHDKESWNAFLRRIDEVIIFEEKGKYTVYNSVDEYFNRNK